jgi:hypothetical protein
VDFGVSQLACGVAMVVRGDLDRHCRVSFGVFAVLRTRVVRFLHNQRNRQRSMPESRAL